MRLTTTTQVSVDGVMQGTAGRWLLAHGLVDEINLLILPVVVGQGERLFPDTGPDLALDLVQSRAFPEGIAHQLYRPAGRPQYATGGVDPNRMA